MHQSLFFVTSIYLFIYSPQQHDEVGTIIFPILQMGKLKLEKNEVSLHKE